MALNSSLEVQVTNDHLNKLIKIKPIKALAELIWNAFDADATNVSVVFERNKLDGIEHIVISDDGHGIDPNKIDEYFGRLGDSHKKTSIYSPNRRRYHGKLGQGRYSGFVLGDKVEWISLTNEDNELMELNIVGNINDLKLFNISRPTKTVGSSTGVKVSITELNNDKIANISDKYSLAKDLSILFAPYLLAYEGITITVDGLILEPKNYIKEIITYEINTCTESNEEVNGQLTFVEWKDGHSKNLYLCNKDGVAYEEENSGIKAGSFSHTFYLQSDIIDSLWIDNTFTFREADSKFIVLRKKADEIIKEIHREKLAKDAAKEIKKLKEEKIYPYRDDANTAVEKAERQVFDIVAVKINQLLPDFGKQPKESKHFTYRLLKEALQTSPDSLELILKEVLNLPTEQQKELANILEKTSLKSIINTTKMISNRIAFLHGLEQILYGQDYNKRLKERSQLHKILLGELWIFGEQYAYGYDDISLKNVLKDHISKLGRDELLDEIDYKNLNGLNDIPDIGLHKQYVIGSDDCYENLIIELKRPSCTIGQKELNQVESYAYAVEENPHFDKSKTKWKFILIGIKLDAYALKKTEQIDRDNGLIYKSDNVEVWVKAWNQVIQDAKGKHKFLKEKLELEVKDNEEGLRYLREKYKEYLPD